MPPRRPFKYAPAKKKQPEPTTSSDFHDLGVSLEESGERWLSGDTAKSLRFYEKALEAYNTALRLDPTNFDAGYNKARVLYITGTDARLVDEWDMERVRAAVGCMRDVVAMKPEHVDGLFNYGQYLAAWGQWGREKVGLDLKGSEGGEVVQVLKEACTVFEKVANLQEERLKEMKERGDAGEEEESAEDEEMEVDDDSEENEEWAVLDSPITEDALLDTVLANLEALTDLVALANDQPLPISDLTSHAETLLSSKILPLATSTNRTSEALLARANFLAAFSHSTFLLGSTSLADYESALESAFSAQPLANFPPHPDPPSLEFFTDKATAYLTLSRLLKRAPEDLSAQERAWKYYTAASQLLSTAATAHPKEKPALNINRGDIDLERASLRCAAAEKNRAVLRKNAGVLYRSVGALGAKGRVLLEGTVKAAMVAAEDGDESAWLGVVRENGVGAVVREAVEEEIFGREWLGKLVEESG